jgi:hypothetical protein
VRVRDNMGWEEEDEGKKGIWSETEFFFCFKLKKGQFEDNFGAKKDERRKDIKNLSVEMVY